MQFAYNLAIIHESPKIFVNFVENLYFCDVILKKASDLLLYANCM